jgi:hypothetical protein
MVDCLPCGDIQQEIDLVITWVDQASVKNHVIYLLDFSLETLLLGMLFIGAIYCEISAASAPDAKGSATIKTITTEFRASLRHSIHKSPKARRAVADFIAEQISFSEAPRAERMTSP